MDTIYVRIYRDNILEDDKNFTLTIDQSTIPDGVSGSPATVTIVDDDRKWLVYSISSMQK